MVMNTRPVLGIDLGGVVMGPRNPMLHEHDEGFDAAFLARPEIPSAIACLARASKERFQKKVFVISKRSRKTRPLALRWLFVNGFFDRLGIPREHVHFCETQDQKAPLCEQLGVTHFVDNRLGVLRHMHAVENRCLLNATEEEVLLYQEDLPRVRRYGAWIDLYYRELS